MAFVAMASVIYIFFWIHFRRENRRRAAGKLDHTTEGMTEEEIEELGEHNPRFRYTY